MTLQSKLLLVGISLIIIGFFILLGSLLSTKTKIEAKTAVVGLLGPIPFGFGNDKKLFLAALIIGALLFIFSLLYRFWPR